jgi:hypothetical protein
VRRFWKRDDGLAELERDLRARRTAAPPAFIRVLAQRAGGEARWLRPRMRFELALGLAVIALVAVASAGGFSAAQGGAKSAFRVVEKLGTTSSTQPTAVASAAADQYKGKCGTPPRKRCKARIDPSSQDVTEGNSGTKTVTFTVSLNQPSDGTVTVTWSTFNGTATAGSDYMAAGSTLTFAFGEQSKTITVQVIGDTMKEKDEIFYVRLTGGANVDIASAEARVRIKNDD